jgi:cellulose synthase/poly-beta-1,6-N-acetylglucosamine synthase-like glycosyltransferase
MMSRKAQEPARSDDGARVFRRRDGRIRVVRESFIDLAALEQDSEADEVAYVAKLEILGRATRDEGLLSRSQKVAGLLAIAAGVIALLIAPVFTVVAVNAALVIFFCSATVMKLVLTDRGIKENCAVVISQSELDAIADEDLPMYTILLPVYREAGMLGQLVDGIGALDYPAERLDVKLLVEEDDVETREAAAAMELPPYFDVIVVPDVGPRGKPRACNQGLVRAKGEFLVIYDAEDRPERDQLRKAVCAFSRAQPDVVCLQAKLNYFNRTHNLLTRWFTAEYSVWFDQLLPGLQSADVAIPLGGTSNHFITARLLELHGWDPFNVTEDADLGMRIFLRGWKTAILDTTTYEEATSRYRNWIRQRSRWVKGYTQTFLMHTRRPRELLHRMGPKAFIVFVLFFGAGTLCLLLNPLYWLLAAWWFASHQHWIETIFPRPVLYAGTVALFIGNVACLLMIVVGTFSRRNYDDVKWAFLSPLYWLLMSVAAWKAVTQLFYKPSFWEKTEHGFCRYEPENLVTVPARAEQRESVS